MTKDGKGGGFVRISNLMIPPQRRLSLFTGEKEITAGFELWVGWLLPWDVQITMDPLQKLRAVERELNIGGKRELLADATRRENGARVHEAGVALDDADAEARVE